MSVHGPRTILPLLVEDLTYEFDGERLLGPLSLSVNRAEALAIIGPNGAGKSLLLRLCHGLIAPSGGTIRFASAAGSIAAPKRHAMVFQKPVMLRRSARENLIHACRAIGFSYGESLQRSGSALHRFGLASLADRPARRLSGGEQQRLAIARAAALDPEILFLDEPTAHLDPGATRQIEDMLITLKEQGMTLVFATHDLPQARRLAERVVFIHRGQVEEDDAASAFFAGPRSQSGKAFIAGDLLW